MIPVVTRAIRLGLLLGAMQLASCAILSGDFEHKVVERSKQDRPEWADLEPTRFHEVGSVQSFVTVKSKLLDLPLGIKQTQLAALTAGQMALDLATKEHAEEVARAQGIKLGVSPELDEKVTDTVKKHYSKAARIADIYYEKLEDRSPEQGEPASFYRVYVLINVDKIEIDNIYKDLGVNLERSRKPELKMLGRSLAPTMPRT